MLDLTLIRLLAHTYVLVLSRFAAARTFGGLYKGTHGKPDSDGAVPIELLRDYADREFLCRRENERTH